MRLGQKNVSHLWVKKGKSEKIEEAYYIKPGQKITVDIYILYIKNRLIPAEGTSPKYRNDSRMEMPIGHLLGVKHRGSLSEPVRSRRIAAGSGHQASALGRT